MTKYVSHHFNWVDDRFPKIDFDALHPPHDRYRRQRGQPDRRHHHPRPGSRRNPATLTWPRTGPRVPDRPVAGYLLGTLGFFFIWFLLGQSRPSRP